MRKGIFERAYLNWHYRKDILMKDISERAFPKGHFDEGHFEGRAFPKSERAKGMKGIVHKLEFSPSHFPLILQKRKYCVSKRKAVFTSLISVQCNVLQL